MLLSHRGLNPLSPGLSFPAPAPRKAGQDKSASPSLLWLLVNKRRGGVPCSTGRPWLIPSHDWTLCSLPPSPLSSPTTAWSRELRVGRGAESLTWKHSGDPQPCLEETGPSMSTRLRPASSPGQGARRRLARAPPKESLLKAGARATAASAAGGGGPVGKQGQAPWRGRGQQPESWGLGAGPQPSAGRIQASQGHLKLLPPALEARFPGWGSFRGQTPLRAGPAPFSPWRAPPHSSPAAPGTSAGTRPGPRTTGGPGRAARRGQGTDPRPAGASGQPLPARGPEAR